MTAILVRLSSAIKVTIHRRSFIEDVELYNHYGRCGILNLLEYKLFKKKNEKKKYHYAPNRYKLLVIQLKPTKPILSNKNGFKTYVFLVNKIFRAYLGDRPIERQYNEKAVIKKIEKRLIRILKCAEKYKASDLCSNSLWDSWRYSNVAKYKFIENYCGKSRFFWEMLWFSVFSLPFLLFAIIILFF